ncbi:MAG: SAM-dependent methyltransferase, partial [Candidatus Micrarchaeota archaeon]
MPAIIERFPEAQRRFNENYYGTREHDLADPQHRLGFATPSHDPGYIEAHAKEYIKYADGKKGELNVHEFGGADGIFAKGFMNYLETRAPDIYNRTHYNLWDKSKVLLKYAKKELEHHKKVKIWNHDVENLANLHFDNSADFIYCHELFDDLPTRIAVK